MAQSSHGQRSPQSAVDAGAPVHLPGGPRGRFVIRRSLWVFWLLFAINTLNYLDRLVTLAVGPTLKSEFHLTYRQIGLLGSAFLLVYTLSALPLGALADRLNARARVVAVGVAAWSVFSGLTAFTRGFGGLFVTRAAVGVGEASYGPAGAALLASYYPPERRASVIGRWQVGQPLGALLAFLVAGALFAWLPAQIAWRAAFLITAIPGLLLAALAWRLADQRAEHARPLSDLPDEAHAPRGLALRMEAQSLVRQALQALRIPMIWVVVALQALSFIVITPAFTFLPFYVQAPRGPFHLGAAHASFALGLTLVVGGFLGAILGGLLSDRLNRGVPGGRVLAITIGFAAAIPCYAVMLVATSLPVFLLASALTALTLNLPTAALTATTQDVAPARLWATAIAVTMLLSHLLGDIWASTAVGALSTALHERIGLALLLVGLPALAVGGALSLVGVRMYARSQPALS